MKSVFLILIACTFSFSFGIAQGNRVFSGGEICNFNIVDISAINGIEWSTERASVPGYFSLVDGANYVGGSDNQNINGYIKKYGLSTFIFPVGSGTDLRTLEISAPTNLSDTYATAWIVGNPEFNLDPTSPNEGFHSVNSFLAPIVGVSIVGQWDWQVGDSGNLGLGTTGLGTGLTINVSIPDMTSFSQAKYLRLVGWDGTVWIDLSGSATANGNSENSILNGTMLAGITAIAIGKIESDPSIVDENDVKEYMILYPNPVSYNKKLYLNFETNYRGKASFGLFNNIGQRLETKYIEVISGSNLIETDVSELAPGTYTIILLNVNGKQIGRSQKFIRI
ncbi:MAG: hypothetical protein ABI851_06100 [Saprospiraceae bacterium]